jgi:hypothetical protein
MQKDALFLHTALLLLLLLLCNLDVQGQAQTINYFLPPGTRSVFGYFDLYKTNFGDPFQKLQAGVEAGYQMNDKVKFTGGLEFWTREPTPLVVVGNRYYPFGPTFIRYRALIGRTTDVALGLGHNLKIGKSMMLEAATDYYLDSREIAFRLGLGFHWQKRSD